VFSEVGIAPFPLFRSPERVDVLGRLSCVAAG
jgi:hypothetical protein